MCSVDYTRLPCNEVESFEDIFALLATVDAQEKEIEKLTGDRDHYARAFDAACKDKVEERRIGYSYLQRLRAAGLDADPQPTTPPEKSPQLQAIVAHNPSDEEREMAPSELERAEYIYTHGGEVPAETDEGVAREIISAIWPRQPDEERARDVSLVAPIIRRLREGWEAKTETKIRQAIEQRDRAEALLLETRCGTPQIMLVPVGWVDRVTALLKERGLL
jgi:hypothetical protein